jgi:MYXO-CTERM domain-containing protein
MTLRFSILAAALGCGLIAPSAHATTTSGGGPADTSDDCGGSCDLASPTVLITSPSDGDEVSTTLAVTVEGSDYCECDTCGCYDLSPNGFSLFVDDELADSCVGCASPHTFDVELAPGVHQLRAQSSGNYAEHNSEAITVTVAAEGATTGGAASTGGAPTTGSETGSSGAPTPEVEDSSGGGCSVGQSTGGPTVLAGFALLFGIVRRRPFLGSPRRG